MKRTREQLEQFELKKLVREISLKIPSHLGREYPDVFTEQFFWLTLNETFKKEIIQIREFWKIKNIKHYTLKENIDFIETNLDKIHSTIMPLAYRCKLTTGKYRKLLIYSIVAYIRSGNIFVGNGLSQIKDIEPDIYYHQDNFSKLIKIEITINTDTEKKDVIKIVKDSWKKIKNLQKEIKGKRYTPVKDFWENLIYLSAQKDYSLEDTATHLYKTNEDKANFLSSNNILKHVQRMKKNISESFK